MVDSNDHVWMAKGWIKLCNSTGGAWILLLLSWNACHSSKDNYNDFHGGPTITQVSKLFEDSESPFMLATFSYMKFFKNTCHLDAYKTL